MNFTLELDNPVTQRMMDIIDPIKYVDRLKMPKLVVDAVGDEFFLPDDVTPLLSSRRSPHSAFDAVFVAFSNVTGGMRWLMRSIC